MPAANPQDDVSIGEALPDVSLPAHDGSSVKLSDYRGSKAIVLFYYPKAHTGG